MVKKSGNNRNEDIGLITTDKKLQHFTVIQKLHTQMKYRQTSNKRRTKSQLLNVSLIILQLSLLNPLKPSIKPIMKM